MPSATAFLSGNLPAEPNSFIGRERDLAELARLHLPDPNAGSSLPRELLMLIGIGLLFTILIVALVHFAVK